MCVCAVCELLHAQIWGLINDIKCTDGKTPHPKESWIKDGPVLSVYYLDLATLHIGVMLSFHILPFAWSINC